jgi:mannose-6-phosphate isomerase-like protein (cupin superfamily)
MDVFASPASDAVSEALRLLNVRSTVFCLSELGSPWAFRVEGTDVAKFHLVLAGSARLSVDGKDPLAIRAGDLVVLPRGAAHTIGDRSGADVVALEQLLRDYPVDGRSRLRYGGGGDVTRLLCGGFVLADHLPESTLELLPDVLRMESTSVGATAWLEPVLATLDSEAANGEPGAGAILAKIADVFLAQAIRGWLVGAERAGRRADDPESFLRAVDARPARRARRAVADRPRDPFQSVAGRVADALSDEVAAQPGGRPSRNGAAEHLRDRPPDRLRQRRLALAGVQARVRGAARRLPRFGAARACD